MRMIGSIALLCALAHGAVADPITVNDTFGPYGIHVTPTIATPSCSILITIDQTKFLPKIPDLQKLGLLNEDLDRALINQKPNMITLAFLIQVVPVVVKETFENSQNIDRCHFTGSVTAIDDYGNSEGLDALSFGFNRSTFKRINWDNFPSQNIIKVGNNFKFSPSFGRKIAAEK